jgi:hypothetical protein
MLISFLGSVDTLVCQVIFFLTEQALLRWVKYSSSSCFWCCRYGNANVWKIFTDLFDYFPLTALVRFLGSYFPFLRHAFRNYTIWLGARGERKQGIIIACYNEGQTLFTDLDREDKVQIGITAEENRRCLTVAWIQAVVFFFAVAPSGLFLKEIYELKWVKICVARHLLWVCLSHPPFTCMGFKLKSIWNLQEFVHI